MPDLRLTRRTSLLLPFLFAACGGEPRNFPPLRYNYLPPIRLNVGSFSVEQRFYPSGMPPDVTALDPVHPVEAVRAMAEDRLQAVGTTGQAVFAITNASLTKRGDVITCALAAVLEIYPTPGIRSGFAQAVVSRQHIGSVDDMRRHALRPDQERHERDERGVRVSGSAKPGAVAGGSLGGTATGAATPAGNHAPCAAGRGRGATRGHITPGGATRAGRAAHAVAAGCPAANHSTADYRSVPADAATRAIAVTCRASVKA